MWLRRCAKTDKARSYGDTLKSPPGSPSSGHSSLQSSHSNTVLRSCVLLMNFDKSLRFACASTENWGALSGHATAELLMPTGIGS